MSVKRGSYINEKKRLSTQNGREMNSKSQVYENRHKFGKIYRFEEVGQSHIQEVYVPDNQTGEEIETRLMPGNKCPEATAENIGK